MATYVVLARFTDKGIHDAKDTVARADRFKDMAKAAGVTVKDIYWTLGSSDIVTICEAADVEAATALSLSIASRGFIRTETMPAFSAEEMSRIVKRIA